MEPVLVWQEILILGEESSLDISFKVTAISPVSECEQSIRLPDCIPVEIKSECVLPYTGCKSNVWKRRTDLPSDLSSVSELIYTLLDLVPVLQVKQLVRSLGVRDTEIEHVELDYRSCREAHYQMLRAWAERGSGPGALLHPPLLQDLLNELRRMHLEQAAEKLETDYGFT